jgi:8-oxo-dGTP pyrophosphatase MutT (NUDIX family)
VAELELSPATQADISYLVTLNLELMEAQNVETGMTVEVLELRMRELLENGYQATLFRVKQQVVGYALYLLTPKYVQIRHFYVNTALSKKAKVENAFQLLRETEFQSYASIRIEVPEANKDTIRMWESIGFRPRSVQLELETARKAGLRKSCGAVIYRKRWRTIEYLTVLHEKGGHWGFPKGHGVAEESEVETAKREIKEEVGLTVSFRDDFYERQFYLTQKERRKEVVFFLSRVRRPRVHVQRSEIREYRWGNYRETRELLTYESSKLVLDRAHDYLQDTGS